MSPRTSGRAADLTRRLELLREVSELGAGRLPDDLASRLSTTLERAGDRLGHGSAHTVVAIAGATGSGKSSLFNALVGGPLAAVGVRRPTTATAQAAVFGGGAEGLLDWLGVARRHVVPAGDLDGLVLLDLPDHDSVESAHREEVDRLVEVVDAFVWVVDPQKYADAALHHRYLSRFARHGAVTLVVLNQIDKVQREEDRRAMLDHIGRLLAADGMEGVRVIATSVTEEEGVDLVHRELVARVAERQALVARLDADVDWLVDDLRVAVGDVTPGQLDRKVRDRLTQALGYAAGVDAVADAVGAAHRHRSAQKAGWPPVRWVRGLKPDPLRRLGLDRAVPGRTSRPGGDPAGDHAVPRTSREGPSVVAEAAVDEALREVASAASEVMPERWALRLQDVANARRGDVADALDAAVSSADLPTRPARWWRAAAAAQWLFTGVMVVGVLWLVLIGVVAWLNLPDLPTPEVRELPWPTLLAVGGALAGLLLAAVARRAAVVGGRRRAARTRRLLLVRVDGVASNLVVEPVEGELKQMERLQSLVCRLDR